MKVHSPRVKCRQRSFPCPHAIFVVVHVCDVFDVFDVCFYVFDIFDAFDVFDVLDAG